MPAQTWIMTTDCKRLPHIIPCHHLPFSTLLLAKAHGRCRDSIPDSTRGAAAAETMGSRANVLQLLVGLTQ